MSNITPVSGPRAYGLSGADARPVRAYLGPGERAQPPRAADPRADHALGARAPRELLGQCGQLRAGKSVSGVAGEVAQLVGVAHQVIELALGAAPGPDW